MTVPEQSQGYLVFSEYGHQTFHLYCRIQTLQPAIHNFNIKAANWLSQFIIPFKIGPVQGHALIRLSGLFQQEADDRQVFFPGVIVHILIWMKD